MFIHNVTDIQFLIPFMTLMSPLVLSIQVPQFQSDKTTGARRRTGRTIHVRIQYLGPLEPECKSQGTRPREDVDPVRTGGLRVVRYSFTLPSSQWT